MDEPMSPPMEMDSPTMRDPGQHYRMMPRDPIPRRELPPIVPQGGYGGEPHHHHQDREPPHHQDRYPQTHHSRMDYSDQEYNDRAAWERGVVVPPTPRGDYYMEGDSPQMPPMDYNGRYLPPSPADMREMREMPPDDMRHHPRDRDYPSPYRGQTMVHRDIL